MEESLCLFPRSRNHLQGEENCKYNGKNGKGKVDGRSLARYHAACRRGLHQRKVVTTGVHDTGNNAKDQVERKNAAAAAEAESTLVEAVAQEIERRSMKRSSTVANQRGVSAQHEHRRQVGWTSTPRGSDDEKKGSERDTTGGERLQNQRTHPPVRIEDEEDAHEVDTGSGCSGGCDLLA